MRDHRLYTSEERRKHQRGKIRPEYWLDSIGIYPFRGAGSWYPLRDVDPGALEYVLARGKPGFSIDYEMILNQESKKVLGIS